MIGDKHDTEAADSAAKRSGRRASQVRRRGMATEPGALASEYADMSNDKIRQIRIRRKPKVSGATMYAPGSAGT